MKTEEKLARTNYRTGFWIGVACAVFLQVLLLFVWAVKHEVKFNLIMNILGVSLN